MTSPLWLGPAGEKGRPEAAQTPAPGPQGELGESWEPLGTCPGSWEGSGAGGRTVVFDICCLWKTAFPAPPAP